MQGLELAVILLAVSAALRVLAGRLNVPHPVLLVLGGLGLAFIPGLPRIGFEPDTLFLLFIPPLLYWASLNTSLRDFRAQLWPIVRYGTLVVLLTMVAVAAVAHALMPEITWPAALVLGAIVSPPDPVAAVAVMRSLGAPRRIVTLLEGEGLVNDATALVAYRIGVAAVVTGTFSPGRAALQFLVTGTGGVVVGLGIGWLIGQVRRRTPKFPIVENTISLLTPFLAYIPADYLGLSGVLAVVSVGLYLGRQGPRIVSAATRVQAESMWTMVQFLLESFIFMLVGLELPYVLRALRSHTLTELIGYGALVALTAIVVRLVYTFAAGFLLRTTRRRQGRSGGPSWREATFVGWTAMRGGDSLVIALALPLKTASGAPFPARELIIFLTFAVIFDTLVLPGPHAQATAPAAGPQGWRGAGRRGGPRAAGRGGGRPPPAGRGGAARRCRCAGRRIPPEKVRRPSRPLVRPRPRGPRRRGPGAPRPGGARWPRRRTRGDRLPAAPERNDRRGAEGDHRLEGPGRAIGDEVLRRVQRDLDLETMLLESGEDDAPESPYDTR